MSLIEDARAVAAGAETIAKIAQDVADEVASGNNAPSNSSNYTSQVVVNADGSIIVTLTPIGISFVPVSVVSVGDNPSGTPTVGDTPDSVTPTPTGQGTSSGMPAGTQ